VQLQVQVRYRRSTPTWPGAGCRNWQKPRHGSRRSRINCVPCAGRRRRTRRAGLRAPNVRPRRRRSKEPRPPFQRARIGRWRTCAGCSNKVPRGG
jgi:hypothetical protein